MYIPHACRGQQCHVHFAFHGGAGYDAAGYDIEQDKEKGYLKFAASNNIIVVFPSFEPAYGGGYGNTENPMIEDPINNTKDGIFPRVIIGMIDILKKISSCPQE